MVYFITIVGIILVIGFLVWLIQDDKGKIFFSCPTSDDDDFDDNYKKTVYRADTHVDWDWFDVQDEKKSTPSPQPQPPSKPSSDVKKPTEAPPAARQAPPTGTPSAHLFPFRTEKLSSPSPMVLPHQVGE